MNFKYITLQTTPEDQIIPGVWEIYEINTILLTHQEHTKEQCD